MSPYETTPVVVVGMHRSGTSLVSRILEGLDLHMGWIQQEANEAVFFTGLNKFLFRVAGTSWQHPEHLATVIGNEDARSYCREYLVHQLACPRRLSYLGPRYFLSIRDIGRWDSNWGWKDPRNTFTLPFWRDLFPDLRVIHVLRHGVDVASSLRARSKESIKRKPGLTGISRFTNWFNHKTRGIDYVGAQSLQNGFDLWETYASEASTLTDSGVESITIRFEDLLEAPSQEVERLAEWIGPEAAPRSVDLKDIDPQRRFAYRSDPDLVEFAGQNSQALNRHGYSSKGFS